MRRLNEGSDVLLSSADRRRSAAERRPPDGLETGDVFEAACSRQREA